VTPDPEQPTTEQNEQYADPPAAARPVGAGVVTVRYWASARSAAGVDHDEIPVAGPITLADVHAAALSLHQDTRLESVLAVCSALIGDRPVGTADPAEVVVRPGESVEFLPPFAGG